MKFDQRGFLLPHSAVSCNLKEFEEMFVSGAAKSTTRDRLFSNYLLYLEKLTETVGRDFYQWIGGSFVTKKREPNDIDVVSFIDYQVVNANEKTLIEFTYPISKELYLVDGYLVRMYPDQHPKKFAEQADRAEWYYLFSSTRRNRVGKKHGRGFINIHIS